MQKNTEIRGNIMGYKINYEKNIEMQLKSEAIIQECLLTLDTAEEVLNKIKTTEAVKCKAKNALNAYMDDVIINRMIAVTREAIQWYVWEQTCYIYEMYEHDDSETAIIEEEHLEDTKSALEEHYRYTEENIEGYRAVVDGISDIISLHAKTPDDMGNGYAGLKERVEKTKDIYGEYQHKYAGRSQNLTEYIRKCYNLVTQCAYSDISMTEYEAAKTDLPGVETLEGERQKLIDDVGYTNEEIEKATQKKEEIVTAYIRRKEGEAKIRKLGGIIIGGLSLLCPMALSFTMPQMILSCSISGISVLYNTDQYLQGKQLLDAAETRNTNAEIDKIVDFKNETLNKGYEIIGTISTTYCGTLMMGTCIYRLGGGNVTFLSATADTGEDLLTDYLAGNIDEALGGGSPLRSMLISSLLSGGINISKGKITGGGTKQTIPAPDAPDVRKVVNDVDVTDVRKVVNDIDAPDVKSAVQNIDAPNIKKEVSNIDAPDISSGKYSLYGEITEGDGKAYERFLKEGPQEGLTEAEIIGIYKADRQATLNEINRNAVSGQNVEGGTKTITKIDVPLPQLPPGSKWERNILNSFAGGKATPTTFGGGTTLYRVGGKNGGFWSLDAPPVTEYQWRVDFAIKQEFCNDASTLYKITIPEGSSLSGLSGTVGTQGMGLYGGANQVYIDYRAVPSDWIEITPMEWR